jgi:hypothetical protein
VAGRLEYESRNPLSTTNHQIFPLHSQSSFAIPEEQLASSAQQINKMTSQGPLTAFFGATGGCASVTLANTLKAGQRAVARKQNSRKHVRI